MAAGGEEAVEAERNRGEKEGAHELRLDGEAVGVGEAEGLVGATLAEEGDAARGAEDVQEALEPAENRDEEGGEKEGSGEFLFEAWRVF